MKNTICSLLLAALLLLGCTACGTTTATDAGVAAETLAREDLFTDRDFEVGYSDYVTITLANGASTADGDGVTISGDTITFTQEGTYLLTGVLSAGQLLVDAGDTAKLQLVLSGASVSASGTAALYIKSADQVFLTLAADTENALCTTGDFIQSDDNHVDAAVFSKADLTMNGGGALTVSCENGHGVVSKDDLKVTGGSYTVNAASQGLSGQDSVRIAGGDFSITAGKDGIHAENTDDTDKGFVSLLGGSFTISAAGDGVSASGTMDILDGTLLLTTGGGASGVSHPDGANQWGGGKGGMETAATDTTVSVLTSGDDTSSKGLKAGGSLSVSGGSISIDSADDAIHTNEDLTISGGTVSITSGDDGIHADGALTISDGEINIAKSYEGIEGTTILVSGGVIELVASDDGLNAAGGNDGSSINGRPGQNSFSADSAVSITISGGTLSIHADGDGIDSNGSLTITGGTTTVSGPTNSGNGALDYNGTAVITGGVLVAAGATGMDQGLGSDSTQGSILYALSTVQTAGTTITLTDSSGSVLASYTPGKQFQSVVVSAPGVESGSTYTLTVGTESVSIELTSMTYSNSTGAAGGVMNGMGHGGGLGGEAVPKNDGGNRGTRPDGTNGGPGGVPPANSETAA